MFNLISLHWVNIILTLDVENLAQNENEIYTYKLNDDCVPDGGSDEEEEDVLNDNNDENDGGDAKYGGDFEDTCINDMIIVSNLRYMWICQRYR